MKYKIRAFCIDLSKNIAKQRRAEFSNLENIIKKHETTGIGTNEIYLKDKLDYENLLNKKAEGAILRSKTKIYEENEKSSKYFLNLEKHNAVRNTIKMLKKTLKATPNLLSKRKLQMRLKIFTQIFQKKRKSVAKKLRRFLGTMNLPKITDELNENLKKNINVG